MGNASAKREEEPVIIGPVGNLTVSVQPEDAIAVVTWSLPSNCNREITGYEVQYKVYGSHAESQCKTIEGASCTTLTLGVDSGLIPLTRHSFEVTALSGSNRGEEKSTSAFIAYRCVMSGCRNNRLRMSDGNIFDFCGRQHAKDYGSKYCMLPGCEAVKVDPDAVLGMLQFFCGPEHIEEAVKTEVVSFLELDPQSFDFQDLSRKFSKSWAVEKGACPTVKVVLAIVNPQVSKRFDEYVKTLPMKHRLIEQYYHGTSRLCSIGEAEFLGLCGNSRCGACGISKSNFQSSRIGRDRWQRFGNGFYLAPNPAKSYDYTARGTQGQVKAMFVCDVAPGNKYNLRYNHSRLSGPPEGYHSVYGNSKFFGDFAGTLNYEELVVFNPDAICPRYLLLLAEPF